MNETANKITQNDKAFPSTCVSTKRRRKNRIRILCSLDNFDEDEGEDEEETYHKNIHSNE